MAGFQYIVQFSACHRNGVDIEILALVQCHSYCLERHQVLKKRLVLLRIRLLLPLFQELNEKQHF